MVEDYRVYDDPSAVSESREAYGRSVVRRRRTVAVSVIAVVALFLLSVVVNNWGYPVWEVLSDLFTHDTDGPPGSFVWGIDVKVLLAAAVAGAGLSLAGAVMQCVLKNPLASPYTLGLSNAAAFGAAFGVLFLQGGAAASGMLSDISVPLAAFAFAMAATALIIVLTRLTGISSETMVLAGIAVSAVFSAGLTLMQYLADPVQLSSIVSWTFGNVSYATYGWDTVIAVVLVLVFLYFYARRWTMNAMGAGDEVARGLGVDTGRFLVVGMTLSAVLAAVMVCEFGVIAFVGLLGPHMARMLVGDDHRFLLPLSATMGACLMLVAQTVAANVVLPMVLPVGLLTSLLGGPAFIYLLVRRYRS